MGSAADASASWSETRGSRARPGSSTVALVFFAVTVTSAFIAFSADEGLLAWDVRFAYLPAAEAVLDGESPYPALDDPILEDQKGYVYPPQLLLALVPFTPLPVGVVALIVTAGLLALLWLTLRVLGHSRRPLLRGGAALGAVASGVLLGNISIPLALAARRRLALPRRGLAAGVGARARGLGEVLDLAAARVDARDAAAPDDGVGTRDRGGRSRSRAWAAIGFDGLTGYPDLLRRLSEIQSENSYSIVGMASTLGPRRVGRPGTDRSLVGGGLLVGVRRLRAARRRSAVVHLRGRGDARPEPDRVAPLPRRAARADGDRQAAVLGPVAAARAAVGQPASRLCGGIPDFMPAVAAGILVAVLLARPARVVRAQPAPA